MRKSLRTTSQGTGIRHMVARFAGLALAFSASVAIAQQADQTQAPAPQAPAPQAPQAPGGAAPQNLQAQNWVKLCSTNPENNEQVCVTTRERRAQTGQLLAAISIRETGEKVVLVAAVPPGMLLQPGLQVRIDQQEPQAAAFTICFPNLCFAEAEVTAATIAAMKAGNQLIVTTLNQQATPVNFDLSLVGFTAANEGDPVDPGALQAEQQRLQEELRRKADEARQQLIERQQNPDAAPAQ